MSCITIINYHRCTNREIKLLRMLIESQEHGLFYRNEINNRRLNTADEVHKFGGHSGRKRPSFLHGHGLARSYELT